MELLRHPDVFAASRVVAGHRLAAIRLDYTERYMWITGQRPGCDAGSAIMRRPSCGPALLLRHRRQQRPPVDTLQLDDLQQAGKSFELQVGPISATPR
jgi:hypothetical protein